MMLRGSGKPDLGNAADTSDDSNDSGAETMADVSSLKPDATFDNNDRYQ